MLQLLKTCFLTMAFLCIGCATSYPRQDVTNQTFPTVSGKGLDGKKWNFPQDLKGEEVVLLVAYKQNTQFDVDRWLIGLDQTKTQATVFELPAIQGFFPRLFKEKIDAGMRRGIPSEIWKAVVTIYADGDKVQKFTGNESTNNARVMVLDKDGVVRYFYDRGFAVSALNELRATLKGLREKR